TAIALLVRRQPHTDADTARFRHLWGRTKRPDLLATAMHDGESLYQSVRPALDLGLPYMPTRVDADYPSWPLLPHLFPVSFPGVKTSRDDVVVDIDRARLVQRMEQYFDPAISHEEMRHIAPGVMQSTARFHAEAVRDHLRKRGFQPENIVHYYYRPFDVRWLYWEPETNLLDRNRAEYCPQVYPGNVWLSAGQRNRKEDFYQPQFTTLLADHHIVESNVGMFPLYLRSDNERTSLFDTGGNGEPRPNLSIEAASYLSSLQVTEQDLFYHILAVLHSPTYRTENAGALRQDWPRVPLPGTAELLRASATLGRHVAALLDTERPVPGVTSGKLRPELQAIGIITRVGGGALNPAAGDLSVTAGWGHAGKGGVTMPGKGRVDRRAYTPDELAAIGSGASALGLTEEQMIACLGATTSDVYLNDTAYWRNVPASVWDYTLGGYQVIKKWLSYREHALLGRALTTDEAREVTHMTHRIAAIVLLSPALDANYLAVKQATIP
ncbi:MAG TPA: type ISP restriction/modification enzyme, partial [Candidatus Saccharimonadia bacterium]|nr:type ISP restriction/modification enzyme [Candidatus Saccharimonadia bacterium]